ncbi:hypothetical protein AB0395_08025 [Streptosporangium sp. NPDC051023]|uniref:hypothetical protein n=1 Tax=Streptosporangium sp. NPDC051023 TaxID=3155410 RepID=UPI00344EE201
MMRIEMSISLREAAFHALASGVDLLLTLLTWVDRLGRRNECVTSASEGGRFDFSSECGRRVWGKAFTAGR